MRLFERLGKQLILTHAGQEYIKKGHEILSLGYQLQDMMQDLSNRDGGHIAIAITPSRGRYVLPNILPEFRMRYPDCEIEIYEGDVCQVEQLLEEGTANVGLFLRDPKREEYPKLKMEEICTEQVLLCVGRDSPYPAHGPVAQRISLSMDRFEPAQGRDLFGQLQFHAYGAAEP